MTALQYILSIVIIIISVIIIVLVLFHGFLNCYTKNDFSGAKLVEII